MTAGKSGYTFFMVVGLVGAFMTAAYMTRCVYLTFFGEYREAATSDPHADEAEHLPAEDGAELHAPHTPHESPPTITVPLWVLSFFAVTAGFLNAEAFHIEKFKEWFEPRVAFPELLHPAFSWGAAGISVAIALIGIVHRLRSTTGRVAVCVNFSEKNAAARAGKTFLVNKYYLDHLYTDIVVGSIKGPIANASYWVNQHVIDAVLNGVGRGSLSRRAVHLRHPRPARGRRHRQRPRGRDGRRRWRGPGRRDRPIAVVRTHDVLRGGALQRLPVDRALTGGVLVR